MEESWIKNDVPLQISEMVKEHVLLSAVNQTEFARVENSIKMLLNFIIKKWTDKQLKKKDGGWLFLYNCDNKWMMIINKYGNDKDKTEVDISTNKQ